ncbi:MAG: hypothetical protein M1281_00300 [Chloroflexi bacterium]|nr:hypothetical protein [Chloroflexota bacterium]
MVSNAFLWLIALPLGSSPIIYLAGRLTRKQPRLKLAQWVSVLSLLAAWWPFIALARAGQQSGGFSLTFGAVDLRFDGLGMLLAGVALMLATLVAVFSGPYLTGEEGEEKYFALLNTMTGAMIGLGCAADLFNLWVWFETMAIASYMLVAFHRNQPGALEAGMKYLVQSAAGSVLILLGISLVILQTGSVNLAVIRSAAVSLPGSPALLAAGALFITGFGVKAALVPLHTWLPDAHSQAPSGISAMLSGVVIEAGLIALLRAIGALAPTTASWGYLLLGIGALNMLVGNLLALRQTQVKRMLAFSSLSHVGYMLLGLGIGFAFHVEDGFTGGFFHLLNHGMLKGLAFLASGALLYTLYISRQQYCPLMISDLAGAARRYPVAAFTLSIALLGLGGLPPLSGFMSKWQIFVAGFRTENTWVIALVIFAALNSVLSLAYYAPLVNTLYRQEPSQAVQQGKPMPFLMNVPLLLLALGSVVLGIWPSLAGWITGPAGAVLMTLVVR